MVSTRACIIGAGSSGITALQVLRAAGVEVDCYEMGSEVGGNWRYDNDNGVSSAYRSLHINTSRAAMEYAAYPMPADLPDYPSHWQIAAYFDDFVEHFGLRESITFRTEVTKVEPVEGGGYDVTVRSREAAREALTHHYDHVLVANGHHWDPRWPEPSFPGSEDFPGRQIHAHYYRTPDVFDGQRVVVLGIGNSATDIAVEASRSAKATYLAMRRGAWIIPKFLFGMPTDHLTDSPLARGPLSVQKLGMRTMLRIAVGKMTDYGLPKPDHDILEAHPTVSDDLLSRLGHGDITVKPSISRFDGSTVRFTDGSSVEADVVVYATGYKITFPFLDDTVVRAEDNHIDLYRRVVSPDRPGLYFIGLVQPLGAVMPLAEAQSHWVADLVTGRVTLPSYAEMRRQIAAYDAALRKRFVASKRHTIEVDFHAYRAELEKERKARQVTA
ncbi:flavin-containing monooxygenase [Nocardioides cynanchi]|uniref:flavin-containing monooxygenase n=1 Tax=Nocardioides cynanchi TaxID=2558918 RepID=UPI001244DC35|nr:NAD(P)-binding domain-containing protein [Nocardioides cynanchi]